MFDNGRLTCDGRVLLLAQAECPMGIAGRLTSCIADPLNRSRVAHSLDDILRSRLLVITCACENTDDIDHLRHDPGLKLATRKLMGCTSAWSANV